MRWLLADSISDQARKREGAVLTKFQEYAGRLQEWCHEQDPVCCSTGFNFLEHIKYFTPEMGRKAVAFVKERI